MILTKIINKLILGLAAVFTLAGGCENRSTENYNPKDHKVNLATYASGVYLTDINGDGKSDGIRDSTSGQWLYLTQEFMDKYKTLSTKQLTARQERALTNTFASLDGLERALKEESVTQ